MCTAFFFVTSPSETALLQSSTIDCITSVETPPPPNPCLRQLVVKHNMHSLCGAFNPSAQCMNDVMCSKRFPKQLVGKAVHNKSQLPLVDCQKVQMMEEIQLFGLIAH